MFRENNQHLQFDFLDPFQQIGEKMRQRLEESWAGTFYREIFCRIDETPFAVLFLENKRYAAAGWRPMLTEPPVSFSSRRTR